ASERSIAPPLQIEKGEGPWLIDMDGNRYFDGTASLWTNVRGHDDPALKEALRNQLDLLAHSTYLGHAHPSATRLARKLAEIAPSELNVTFFSDNGSCAVEIALKMSFQYWQLVGQPEKQKVASMEGAYHGDTFGSMSIGGKGAFRERFQPWCFEVEHFPAPICRESAGIVHESDASRSLAVIKALLEREGPCLAAVVLEPSVQGAAGMKQQPPGFVKEVAALCKNAGVHLILDEVFVAFGRIGAMFVCGEEGVQPDFLCLAKGLTGGYLPLAATMTTSDICAAFTGPFHEHRTFCHGHTFTANPLAAAVALRNVEMLEEDLATGLVGEGVEAFGQFIQECFGNHSCVSEVRQRGLACCLDLCPAGRPDQTFPETKRAGLEVCMEARKHGVLLRPLGNAIPVVPPILSRPDEIEFLCTALSEALDATLAKEQYP
ncbi:MAG: adenosylmethionine--8-amino-7-oxononanoate transaminase, partial [Opitutales bacterium]